MHVYVRVVQEKMAANAKRLAPQRIRHTIETEAAKEALAQRLSLVSELLTPFGSHLVDQATMLNSMFDIVERVMGQQSTLMCAEVQLD